MRRAAQSLRARPALVALRRVCARPVAVELAAAHQELARRQSFTDAVLETIDVGIVSCDADGRFVVNNRAERDLFGLDGSVAGRAMGFLEADALSRPRPGAPALGACRRRCQASPRDSSIRCLATTAALSTTA